MPKKQVVFLGSKAIGAYCFEFLYEQTSKHSFEIAAVVSKENPALDGKHSVVQLAKDRQIPVLISVHDIPDCNVIISVQHHEILKQQHLDKAKDLAVNLHMAPLPEYRGCNQFSFAILDGKTEFGTTLHKMTCGIDDGDIIAERRFEIGKDIWVEELYDKTVGESKLLFAEHITDIIHGRYNTMPQKEFIESRGTSYHYRNEIAGIKVIDESWPLAKKKLHVRATYKNGFEPPYSLVDGKKKYYTKTSF